jgi:N-acetylmuramoyl-L-alanine amidase
VTSKMPAVLLEFGVLSNKQECKDLANEAYQTRLAQAVSAGLVSYFEETAPKVSSAHAVVTTSSTVKSN